MEPLVIVVVVLVVVGLLVYNMFRNRKRRMEEAARTSSTAPATGLAVSRDLFEAKMGHRAPVESFHVVGDQARVTFDVPLDDEDDQVLFDLLTDEAVEVVRQKRHTLPIDEVDQIVVFAGRDPVRVVGRTKLPATGELPPPALDTGLSLSHIAHDPFAAPFEDEGIDHGLAYETRADVPADELPPLRDELRIPKGLDRGLRALGTDPANLNGPEFVIALLRMFGYGVTEQAYEGTYLAVKDGVSTYIGTDAYEKGDYPELEERVIRRFLADFGSSAADRGMLVSDKYSPFLIHEIETNQPKVKFITRERVQRFIDSMALG
ncbi:MAG TPA: hypothetical protein VMQ46_02775 [Acidimicrobiia bacterium]|nr:hypothetical protein [Acidimicrobiia bacterium]